MMWNNEGGYHLDNNELAKFQAVGSDTSIAKLLRSQSDINEDVIRKMCDDVTYADLSALQKDDLELFGVNAKEKQFQLVSEFSTLTNQEQSLKKFLDGMKANDYQEKIYCQVRNQLNAIALILEAVEQHTDSQRNNILVKPNVYISMILVRALENVSTNSKKQINHFTWICCGAALAFFFAARKMM